MSKERSVSLPVFLILAVLALGAVYYSGLLSIFTGRSQSFTKSVEKGGYFYRVKVDLTYEDEPIPFDVVVACGVTITNYRDGDRSFDASMTPIYFMQRIADNHGVMLKVPQLCQGQTNENGKVPSDFLPGIVWFMDADNWVEGLGYFTELAYENPRAQLKFNGASVQAVSRAEWEDWRKTEEPKNLVPAHVPNLQGLSKEFSDEVSQTWSRQRVAHELNGPAASCQGAQRFKMTEDMREIVRDYWPDTQPRYWAATGDKLNLLWQQFYELGPDYKPEGLNPSLHGPLINDVQFDFYFWNQENDHVGFPTRSGGGLAMKYRAKFLAPEIYPVRQLNTLKSALKTAIEFGQEDFIKNFEVDDGDNNGFLYCYASIYPLAGKSPPKKMHEGAHCTVDDEPIQMERSCWNTPRFFFDRDEYLYRTVRY